MLDRLRKIIFLIKNKVKVSIFAKESTVDKEMERLWSSDKIDVKFLKKNKYLSTELDLGFTTIHRVKNIFQKLYFYQFLMTYNFKNKPDLFEEALKDLWDKSEIWAISRNPSIDLDLLLSFEKGYYFGWCSWSKTHILSEEEIIRLIRSHRLEQETLINVLFHQSLTDNIFLELHDLCTTYGSGYELVDEDILLLLKFYPDLTKELLLKMPKLFTCEEDMNCLITENYFYGLKEIYKGLDWFIMPLSVSSIDDVYPWLVSIIKKHSNDSFHVRLRIRWKDLRGIIVDKDKVDLVGCYLGSPKSAKMTEKLPPEKVSNPYICRKK